MDLKERLTSLDVLRGLTIAGMIVVNDPGSWSYVYPPLRHAPWHGITPTDFVFPFFLFIVGVSIVLSYSKRRQQAADTGPLIRKTLVRTAMIFGMGLFLAVPAATVGYKIAHIVVGIVLLYGLSEIQIAPSQRRRLMLGTVMFAVTTLFLVLNPNLALDAFRWPGVLQRIAIVFLVCAFLFLYTSRRTQIITGVVLLVGYWLMMVLLPVPADAVVQAALASGEVMRASGPVAVEGLRALSETSIAANLEPGTNLAAWIDRVFTPGRIYEKTWDPEGLLSTLPAIGSGIAGMVAGHIILQTASKEQTALRLFVYGFCLLVVGSVWNWFFPFNKNLWTSSFVLYTSSLITLTFAALFWYVDLHKKGKNQPLFYMGRVFGANAIAAYALHSLFARILTPVRDGFMDTLMGQGVAGEPASLLWALLYTLFIFLIAWVMYRQKLFLRL
ncbi:MAG: DUF5009 domain-containing protein [Bacteroidota bacterium]